MRLNSHESKHIQKIQTHNKVRNGFAHKLPSSLRGFGYQVSISSTHIELFVKVGSHSRGVIHSWSGEPVMIEVILLFK